MCVSHNTLGCTGEVKGAVESTLVHVKSVVNHLCAPVVAPEPSMQCSAMVTSDETTDCDVSAAAQCMYELYNELMCDRPDYEVICPYVQEVCPYLPNLDSFILYLIMLFYNKVCLIGLLASAK